MVNFDLTDAERTNILLIADRAVKIAKDAGVHYSKVDCLMDITAAHKNGCELDLEKLLTADDFNLSHDVFGIRKHIDRNTGELTDCFLPRCAK